MNAAFVAARAVHFGAAMLVFGEFVFVVFVAGTPWQRAVAASPDARIALDRHAFVLVAFALVASALSGVAWLLIEATAMAGAPIGQVLGNGTLGVVLRETEFGHVFVLRTVLWFGLVAAAMGMRGAGEPASSRVRAAVATPVAAAYLATLAGAGHAAAAMGGTVRVVHLGGDALHLLAAGGWLGALPPLVHCLAHASSADAVARLARRFSVLGIVCVGVLTASGIVNALFLVGSFAALFGTGYGQLLIVKLALFAVMLGFAATNRFRLTPRLAGDDRARRSLQRNAMLELGGGVVIVALVGALGTMVPGAHQSPLWPFDFALDFDFANLSDRMLTVFIASVLVALAAVAIIIGGVRRKAMRLSIPGCAALLASAAVSTSIFAVPAFPTTYATPPVPYAVDTVARGASRFAEACSSCHGADARGNGPAAATLPKRPTNLAEHALHHPQGNLFWWIAHGIAGTPMPAFSPQIDDHGIWEIVQYLVARGSAEAALSIGPHVDNRSMSRAPDFSYEVAGQGQRSLAAQRTPALIVLYSAPQSDARLSQLASDHRIMHSDLRVIPIPLSGSHAAGDAHTWVSSDVASVYAMFAGTMQPPHVELLVDGAGTVRARWSGIPADGNDRDAEIAAAMQRLPTPSQMPASMHHGH